MPHGCIRDVDSSLGIGGHVSRHDLIIIESKLAGPDLLGNLSRLAEVCDSDTKVIVIGHHNDIAIYREMIASGISDYLVAPLSMADLMNSVSSAVSRVWFGHSILNCRTSSITCLKRSLAHLLVIAPPSRVAA